VASHFQGRRLNSPNDLCRNDAGVVFFTDPPYGLEGLNDSKAKEQRANGVYRVGQNGKVELVDDQLAFPNGIALSPDQRTLYVANCDREQPLWMAYAVDAAGKVSARRVFAEAKDLVTDEAPGAPDGLAIAADGTLFATGPGGVIVMSASGKRLGRISTGKPVSNCTFGDDGRSLYLTTHDTLARIRLNVRGHGFAGN
jgi:gluconolactonase